MQAITDMLGGTIHVNIGTTTTLLPLIREGKVRAIAVWAKERDPDLPDVPTMIESGFKGLSLASGPGCGRRPARRMRSSTSSTTRPTRRWPRPR